MGVGYASSDGSGSLDRCGSGGAFSFRFWGKEGLSIKLWVLVL